MSTLVLLSAAALFLTGCGNGAETGINLKVGELKVGGDAKLVSFDGSDVILVPYVATQGKQGRRPATSGKPDKIELPVGTLVLVKAIVGDDAHVEIMDGARAGSNYWVECNRLEPFVK